MIPFDFINALYPELMLCCMAIVLLLYGAFSNSKHTLTTLTFLAVLTLALTCAIYVVEFGVTEMRFQSMYRIDAFTLYVKIIIILSALISLLLSHSWLKQHHSYSKEFPVLVLFATLGLTLLVSSESLLSFYVSLELASLSMYVMAAYERDNRYSSEAGLKYFVLGSLASGMLLFGSSLIYGFAGTTQFTEIQLLFNTDQPINLGIIVGLVLVLVAICFKVSAVPFHMWTPDVYEGAPTPVVTFFATAPKIAVISFTIHLLLTIFGKLVSEWQQIIIVISVASMILGALAGLVQHNIKRLIAYSSIGHMGYILMGLAAATENASQSLLIYLTIYVIMSFGLFACLIILKFSERSVATIQDLSGLSRSHPKVALAIAILMFSMAGIPPFIGFFAKMFVFSAVINAGLVWLAVIGVLTSVIACFYYIRVIKIMYFDEQIETPEAIEKHNIAAYVLCVSILLNCFIINPSVILIPTKIAAGVLFP